MSCKYLLSISWGWEVIACWGKKEIKISFQIHDLSQQQCIALYQVKAFITFT